MLYPLSYGGLLFFRVAADGQLTYQKSVELRYVRVGNIVETSGSVTTPIKPLARE